MKTSVLLYVGTEKRDPMKGPKERDGIVKVRGKENNLCSRLLNGYDSISQGQRQECCSN